MFVILVLVICYLIGAIPFGYLVARWVKGIDIREHGSKNIGATNVGRVLGLKWFFVVFLLDFIKAGVPVSILLWGWLPDVTPETWPHSGVAALAGLAILIGNMFPVYLNFRGGKGAATGTGVMLPMAPWALLAAIITFLVVFFATRYVSLGSILAALVLSVTQLAIHRDNALSGENLPITLLCLAGTALVIWRHRSNIVRLWNGTENRITRNTN